MSSDSDKAINMIPSRVKYYLLEWKDKNLEEFKDRFGAVSLSSLTLIQLHALFMYATIKDSEMLFNLK